MDCVVTDIGMPEMDGFQLCRAIRGRDGLQRVRIMFLTDPEDHAAVRQAYEEGGDNFAIRQSNPVQMVERIRFLLRAQQTQDRLRASERRLERAQGLARLGHWERQPDGRTVAASRYLLQLLGEREIGQLSWQRLCRQIEPEDLERVQQAMHEALARKSTFAFEHRYNRADGQQRVLRHAGEIGSDDRGDPLICSTVQDVTDVRARDDQIQYLSLHDQLTSLPNQESFLRTLGAVFEADDHGILHAGVFAIGIDATERITGSVGRDAVDKLLKIFGARLAAQLRNQDESGRKAVRSGKLSLLARADGDKFLCAVDLKSVVAAATMAARLQRALAKPVSLGTGELQFTASLGISLYPNDASNAAEMVRNALSALAHTTDQRNVLQFYTDEVSARARRRLALESTLRRALDARQFTLHYQPRLQIASGRLCGAEALVRWNHPTRGLQSPGKFVPVLESMGLISVLGRQVVEMTAAQARLWHAHFGGGFRVSCNLSPLEFRGGDLVRAVDEDVARAGGVYQSLEFEITEGALLDRSAQVLAVLQAFRERGVRLALDDFGTGFSSLGYLRQLPLDILKIDRSFIADIVVSRRGGSLVIAILQMARALGIGCVAEGVEDPRQLQFLSANRCEEVQGFLLARPMAAADFENWAKEAQQNQTGQTGEFRFSAKTA
jgi:diguanylate cyclase (GGDEF)-like protein